MAGLLALCVFSTPVFAVELLPTNFFDQIPDAGAGQAGVEADALHFDENTSVMTASGNVALNYAGYYATADEMIFNQKTRDLTLIGHVYIVDPKGVKYKADQVEVTDGFKQAVLNTMDMVTPEGALVTSTQTVSKSGQSTVLEHGTYAPCGRCVDEKGRRIGWRLRTRRMVENKEDDYVELDQPVLEILGVPIAWVPWLRMPTPDDIPESGFRAPSYTVTEKVGSILTVPYFYSASRDVDVLFTPALVSQQGFLMGAEVTQRVSGLGKYSVKASGIHQLDPGKLSGERGELDNRWALQTSGKFTPTDEWTVGWTYSRFSDPDFLPSYELAYNSVNEAYATYLDPDTFADVRAQEFLVMGDVEQSEQDEQGVALPSARFTRYQDLDDKGRLELSGRLLGVQRGVDSTETANGYTYTYGYAGQKMHGMLEGTWSQQYISSNGLVTTPYVGARVDAAYYDSTSSNYLGDTSLFQGTPIAALDVRYPLRITSPGVTQIVEPVAQLVYHGSDTSLVGITNDDAQSFVFDDSELFSFNRFSGTDRMETGLRANLGAQYQIAFENGVNLNFVGGQAFHLAGTNAYTQSDGVLTSEKSRFADGTSELVGGATLLFPEWLSIGTKLAYDPQDNIISRAALAGQFSKDRFSLGLGYYYSGPNEDVGSTDHQQTVSASLGAPLADYVTFTGTTSYDINEGTFDNYNVALTYDDGYLLGKAAFSVTDPTLSDDTSWAYTLTLKLKGPTGSGLGLTSTGSASGASLPSLDFK